MKKSYLIAAAIVAGLICIVVLAHNVKGIDLVRAIHGG